MSTTTLYVELLIIGFEVLVWLAMLLDVASTRINLQTLLGQTSTDVPALLQTALVLSLAYLLGIMVDKFAKWVMENLRGCLMGRKQSEERLRKYSYVVTNEGEQTSDLLFVRSKVRILRASVITLPLITVTAWPFLKNHYPCELELRVLVVSAGIVFSLLAIWGYRYISGLYDNRLEQFYIALKRKELREAKN